MRHLLRIYSFKCKSDNKWHFPTIPRALFFIQSQHRCRYQHSTIFVVFGNFVARNEPARAELNGEVQQRNHYMEPSVYAV